MENNILQELIHKNALKPILEVYCDKLEFAISKGFLKYANQYRDLIVSAIEFTDIVEKPIKNQSKGSGKYVNDLQN